MGYKRKYETSQPTHCSSSVERKNHLQPTSKKLSRELVAKQTRRRSRLFAKPSRERNSLNLLLKVQRPSDQWEQDLQAQLLPVARLLQELHQKKKQRLKKKKMMMLKWTVSLVTMMATENRVIGIALPSVISC